MTGIHTETPTKELAEQIRERYSAGHRLALMESCTGGLLAGALTDIAGSGYLVASTVCYDAAAKVAMGVPSELIEQHGLVSAEVAAAMATAAANFFSAEFGMATTGVAGPGSEEGIPPGTVWLGLHLPSGATLTRKLCLEGDRTKVKHDAVHRACALLLEFAPEPGAADQWPRWDESRGGAHICAKD